MNSFKEKLMVKLVKMQFAVRDGEWCPCTQCAGEMVKEIMQLIYREALEKSIDTDCSTPPQYLFYYGFKKIMEECGGEV